METSLDEFQRLIEEGSLSDEELFKFAVEHNHHFLDCAICEGLYEDKFVDVFTYLFEANIGTLSDRTLRYIWDQIGLNVCVVSDLPSQFIYLRSRAEFGLHPKADKAMFQATLNEYEILQSCANDALDVTSFPGKLRVVFSHPHGGEQAAREYLNVMHDYGDSCSGTVDQCQACDDLLSALRD